MFGKSNMHITFISIAWKDTNVRLKCSTHFNLTHKMQENYATFTKELQWRSLWSVFTLVLRISVSFMLTTEEILFLWDCRLRGGMVFGILPRNTLGHGVDESGIDPPTF